MLGGVNGGDQRKFVVGRGQRDQPLSHPSRGPVNGNAKWHDEWKWTVESRYTKPLAASLR